MADPTILATEPTILMTDTIVWYGADHKPPTRHEVMLATNDGNTCVGSWHDAAGHWRSADYGVIRPDSVLAWAQIPKYID